LADLDAAITAWTNALEILPEDQYLRGEYSDMRLFLLWRLNEAHSLRFQRNGDQTDQAKALNYVRDAYSRSTVKDDMREDIIIDYSNVLIQEYQIRNNVEHLQKSKALASEALELPQPELETKIKAYTVLCIIYQYFYTRLRNQEDLDQAIMFGKKACNECESNSLDVDSRIINILAIALRQKFKESEDFSVLNEAIDLMSTARNALPPGHPDLPIYDNNLGEMLNEKYKRRGQVADLDAALVHCQNAMKGVCSRYRPSWSFRSTGDLWVVLLRKISADRIARGPRNSSSIQQRGFGACSFGQR
jgi:hypothetical protein